MVSVIKATSGDYKPIADIGRVAVEEAHRASAPAKDMSEYIEGHYNNDAIRQELNDTKNIYHIIKYNESPAGFSKIVFDAAHPNIAAKNVTKLDRIYLLKEFQGHKLGLELLKFNIGLAKRNNQSGMWLFTWVGNTKAIDFYLKAGFTIIGIDRFKVSKTHYNDQHQMLLNFSET
jgi:GNAT superfamily N-acetyltransferase